MKDFCKAAALVPAVMKGPTSLRAKKPPTPTRRLI